MMKIKQIVHRTVRTTTSDKDNALSLQLACRQFRQGLP